jgi:hypothetical protein
VVEVSDEKSLVLLAEKLHTMAKVQGSVTMATSGSRFSLDEIVIWVSDTLYNILPKNLEIRDFLSWISHSGRGTDETVLGKLKFSSTIMIF